LLRSHDLNNWQPPRLKVSFSPLSLSPPPATKRRKEIIKKDKKTQKQD
jgi:hypothetical protein